MCFFSRQSKKAVELEHRYKATIKDPGLFKANAYINGFSFPKTPVVADEDRKFIQHFQWGLIPAWSKDDSIKQYTLNAKIETLKEKPSFRNSVNKRCLVIADGFYEWKWLDPKGKKKQKYLVTLPDEGLFSFGGIWAEWADKSTGEIIRSYSLVTTEANELMAEIHNSKKRMPVVLSRPEEKKWLNGDDIENFKICNTELIATTV